MVKQWVIGSFFNKMLLIHSHQMVRLANTCEMFSACQPNHGSALYITAIHCYSRGFMQKIAIFSTNFAISMVDVEMKRPSRRLRCNKWKFYGKVIRENCKYLTIICCLCIANGIFIFPFYFLQLYLRPCFYDEFC